MGQGLEAERDPTSASLSDLQRPGDTTVSRTIFLMFMVCTVAVVAVIRLLPWWAAIALFAVLILAARSLFRWGLPRLLRLPFKAKGAVLHDAAVDVHSIESVEPSSPKGSDEHDRPFEPRLHEHFRMDVTITPRTPTGAFALWEPGELRVVGPDARAGDPEAGESDFEIRSLEVLEDGQFQSDSGMKYHGPQRLRLLVAVPAGQPSLRLRYYFEILGHVTLPGLTSLEIRRAPRTLVR